MGITILKKSKWILLAFSIALNIGFIVTVASQKAKQNFDFPGKRRGPVMAVLD